MISYKRFGPMVVKTVRAWADDGAPSMGAAISYYTVFSLAPLLVIMIAVAGGLFGREAVQGRISAQLSGLLGPQGAGFVEALVAAASNTDKGLIAGMASLAVLVVGATSVFAELQSALDRIWQVPGSKQPSGVWPTVRARLMSFGLVLGLAFILVASLMASTVLAFLGTVAAASLPGGAPLLHGLTLAVSLGLFTLLFAMIFKLLPSAPIAWGDVWVGAFVTALLFEAGKLLIAFYIGRSGMSETFAAAGSLVVLLAWVYYAAQIFLLGAEFTKVYADEHGSMSAQRAIEATRMKAVLAEKGLA